VLRNLGWALVLLAAGACLPPQHGFSRLPGAARRLDIPVYQGTPLVIYTHVKLGEVSGKAGTSSSSSEQRYRALYNMAEAAKAKGANAVIEAVGTATDDGFIYRGQAVTFDILPPEPSPHPYTTTTPY
jgi:hypothetical protein